MKTNRHTRYGLKPNFITPSYLVKKITSWMILHPDTPKREPIDPHSVNVIKVIMHAPTTMPSKIHHGDSKDNPHQKIPSVEAIPLPPLYRVERGRICPSTTNTAVK